MSDFSVHPTTRLVLWLVVLLFVQCLSGMFLAMACLLLPFCGMRVLLRGGRLIWRTRWLLLSLVVIFSWSGGGEPLWPGVFSPTQEGMQEALTHLGRLSLVLIAVAYFLEIMPLNDLLAATHALLKPMRHFGLDPDRGVVRLLLVLRYVETLPRPRDWRALLNVPALDENEVVEVTHQPLRGLDFLLMAFFAVVVLFFYLWQVFR